MRLPLLITCIAALLVTASPVSAKGGDDDNGRHGGGDNDARVIKRGDCSGASNWKLKAKPDDGGLEVEFEVDQNRSGVKWNVVLRRNGKTVARGSRTTVGRSGSFEFERKIGNPAGKDRISGVATRSGETCRAALSI
jgi:hypothetical protein